MEIVGRRKKCKTVTYRIFTCLSCKEEFHVNEVEIGKQIKTKEDNYKVTCPKCGATMIHWVKDLPSIPYTVTEK